MAGHDRLFLKHIHFNQAKATAIKGETDRKRKMTEQAKEKRRQSKYSRLDESVAARRAYSRHDDGVQPDDITDDVPPEQMATREQSYSDLWKAERLKRITASKIGTIAKMLKKTKRANTVKQMLYTTFRGNEATRYGTRMEDTTRQDYVAYQREQGHSNLTVSKAGLVVSVDNTWLAASSDDRVTDPDDPQPFGASRVQELICSTTTHTF